jgi:prevent-host-death family protein
MRTVGIEEARNTLGDIVDRARLRHEPTVITRNGKAAAIIMNVDAQPPAGTARYMSNEEIDALVRGYDEARLRQNYAKAAEHPGTVWHRILMAEMARRGLYEDDPS